MSRRSIVYGAMMAAVLIVGTGAWIRVGGNLTQPAAPATRSPALTVSVIRAERKTLDDTLDVAGATAPRQDVVVIPELTGLRIQDIHAEVGDYVKKGQKLAALDSTSLEIELQRLRTEYDRTREEYQSFLRTQSSGAVSREALARRRAAFEVARSRWENAQLSVKRTVMVAPTDGLVYERQVAIGGLTNGSEPMFRLVRNGKVEVAAAVPEALARRVRPGMPVSLKFSGNSAPVTGTVRLITPRVDSDSRTTEVRISFKRKGFVPIGLFCEASITVRQVDGWVLPGTALQQDSEGMFVWAVSAQRNVVRKAVTVLFRTPESVVVEEALGDYPIVAKAGSFLEDGDLVAVHRGR